MPDITILSLAAFALWGLIVGVMVGFTAIGTGLLGVSGLMILFGLEPVTAVGSMGVAGVAMMASSTVQHFRNGNVELRIALPFALTALPCSLFAALYADEINEVLPLKLLMAVIILLSTALLFYRYIILKPQPRELEVPRWKMLWTPLFGIVLGAIMGATSISGSIIVLMMLVVLQLPSTVAIGTSSFVAALSLLIAGVAHVQQGHVDWEVVLGLIPGVLVGAAIGAKYVNKVPRQVLRIGILIILAVAGIGIIFK